MLVHLVINVGRFGNNASPQKKHWNGARPTTNLVRYWTPLSGGRTLLKCTKTKSNVQQRTRFVVGRAFWWSVEILLIKAVLVSPSEFGGYLGLFETLAKRWLPARVFHGPFGGYGGPMLGHLRVYVGRFGSYLWFFERFLELLWVEKIAF